jgi:hypothetical protein
LERLTLTELAAVLTALRPTPWPFRRMAAVHFGIDDSPDGWCSITPDDAAEVIRRAARFGQRVNSTPPGGRRI